ncbi:MAG: twin-arginine translocase TatA/TatE family subunit [Nitrospirota bacterium]|nr:twin-arginine translocase TatA/TatE family subunit [Nitrospirota bacterium]MDH4359354.1 twin-arginine translocase TatA/TatE family subunit [Nitrospirota bacterium]
MFGSFGWMELMLILIIVLIIFGAGKIPQLGEGLGKAIKGFKKSVAEADALDVTPNEQGEGGQAPQPHPEQLASQQHTAQAPSPPPAQGGQQPAESTQSKQG